MPIHYGYSRSDLPKRFCCLTRNDRKCSVAELKLRSKFRVCQNGNDSMCRFAFKMQVILNMVGIARPPRLQCAAFDKAFERYDYASTKKEKLYARYVNQIHLLKSSA